MANDIIGMVKKNKSEIYVISIGEYKGKNYIDVRINFPDKIDESKLIPTKKGITLSKHNFQEIVGLMLNAWTKLEKLELKPSNETGDIEQEVPEL